LVAVIGNRLLHLNSAPDGNTFRLHRFKDPTEPTCTVFLMSLI
jgi:hypothetical protein